MGVFIRKWVLEMEVVLDEFIYILWMWDWILFEDDMFKLGRDYFYCIVDYEVVVKEVKKCIVEICK